MSEIPIFTVSGLLPISGTGPGFATPLFTLGNSVSEYVQQIDDSGIITRFIPTEIPRSIPRIRSALPKSRAVGDSAFFGISVPEKAPFVAERHEIASTYETLAPFFKSYPFVHSQLAKFTGARDHIDEIHQATSQLLRPGNVHVDRVETILNYFVKNGRKFEKETEVFSMNPIHTIQNAARFVDSLLINDSYNQSTELKNWANNTPFDGSIENYESLIHFAGQEAIYLSFLSGMKYNADLAESFSTPGQESIAFSSSIEGAMQRESKRHSILNINSDHSSYSTITFQSVHSRIRGNFLDLRDSFHRVEPSDIKVMSLIGEKIAGLGYDGVLYPQHDSQSPNAYALVSYNLSNITSVVQSAVLNLNFESVGQASWSNAGELV